MAEVYPDDNSLLNLTSESETGVEYIDNDLSIIKQRPLIIQWLPENSPDYTIELPDGSKLTGHIERSYVDNIGKVAQLERVGYTKLEKETGLFLHK